LVNISPTPLFIVYFLISYPAWHASSLERGGAILKKKTLKEKKSGTHVDFNPFKWPPKVKRSNITAGSNYTFPRIFNSPTHPNLILHSISAVCRGIFQARWKSLKNMSQKSTGLGGLVVECKASA